MITGTILDYLSANMANNPEGEALGSTNGVMLSHGQFHSVVWHLNRQLIAGGVKKYHRIAVVLTKGIDLAITLFAVSPIACFAPLSPYFSFEQYVSYFQNLGVQFLMIEQGYQGPAKEAAEAAGIPILFLQREEVTYTIIYQLKGAQFLQGQALIADETAGVPRGRDDISVLLLTSGTTSVPNVVPFTRGTVGSVSQSCVELTSANRCLIVTPMFKGVSLNFLLAAIIAGGCAIICENFQPHSFFDAVKKYSPTWFGASPALHKSLVDYAENNSVPVKPSTLEFVRSTGASLDEALADRIYNLYGAPVIVTYASTEAHILATNYNAPKGYKRGSVGVAYNCEIAIADEKGNFLPVKETGEIVVKSTRVMRGYENKDIDKSEIFFGDWFRTGDLGYLDEDDYLFLRGRIKELINRGGEKVSPFEVEKYLLAHPQVSEAVVFPVPYLQGTEEVGCLLVLKEPGFLMDLKELRSFLADKMPYYWMPTKVFVGSSIPVTESGKISRNSLYQVIEGDPQRYIALENKARAVEDYQSPRTASEETVQQIFSSILKVEHVSVGDNFFELGGDSLKAARLFTELQNEFGKQIPLSIIYAKGTVEALAQYLDNRGEGCYSFIVPIREYGTRTPLFFVHPASGEVVAYRHMAGYLSKDRPVYGLRMNNKAKSWRHPLTLGEIAGRYIEEIKLVQPRGPYLLAGTCIGGVLAYEMALQLRAENKEVALVGMFDPLIEISKNNQTKITRTLKQVQGEIRRKHWRNALKLMGGKAKRRFRYYRIKFSSTVYRLAPVTFKEAVALHIDKEALLRSAASGHRLGNYPGEVVFFKPEENTPSTLRSLERWSDYVDRLKVVPIKTCHDALFSRQHGGHIAEKLEECIAALNL